MGVILVRLMRLLEGIILDGSDRRRAKGGVRVVWLRYEVGLLHGSDEMVIIVNYV